MHGNLSFFRFVKDIKQHSSIYFWPNLINEYLENSDIFEILICGAALIKSAMFSICNTH